MTAPTSPSLSPRIITYIFLYTSKSIKEKKKVVTLPTMSIVWLGRKEKEQGDRKSNLTKGNIAKILTRETQKTGQQVRKT